MSLKTQLAWCGCWWPPEPKLTTGVTGMTRNTTAEQRIKIWLTNAFRENSPRHLKLDENGIVGTNNTQTFFGKLFVAGNPLKSSTRQNLPAKNRFYLLFPKASNPHENFMVHKSPNWWCGTPYKWPNSMAYKWGVILTTYIRPGIPSSKRCPLKLPSGPLQELLVPKRNSASASVRTDGKAAAGVELTAYLFVRSHLWLGCPAGT